jgi:hypothetical protein
MSKLIQLRLSAFFVVLSVLAVHAQTVTTFEGNDASKLAHPEFDVDPNGAIGTKQFMEWTNVYYQAWDKNSFAPIWSAPVVGTTPFTTNGITTCNISGDGVVIFDRLASRWVIAAHNSGSTSYYYCVAVSNTDDLSSSTLAWYTYAFPLNSALGKNKQGNTYFPDWPKIATWSDAYYVALDLEDPNNGFQEVGVVVCALDRTNMLTNGTPNALQCFRNPDPPTGAIYLAHSLQPADVEGTTPPPASTPEYYVSIQNPPDDGVSTTSDALNLWQFHVDWTTPANSTFTQSTVSVPTYTPGCYSVTAVVNTVCVPEPSSATTNQDIDSVGDRFMFRFAYRNFGTYDSFLVSHTIQVGSSPLSQTGIRWYELRNSAAPTLNQSGTISPDESLYRFMPSIAQDQNGNAAVGYSTSSSSAHPGMSASYWSLTAETSPTEVLLYNGTADEENSYHWGDYSSMTVDPSNDCTFWYVNQYFNTADVGTDRPTWQTRISNFSLPSCAAVTVSPAPLTFAAQPVASVSGPQPVTLYNGLSTPISINNVFGGGADPGDFKQSNNCGSSLSAGASCTISISFDPTALGTRTATLNVSDTAPNSPQVIALSGTGSAPVTLSSTSLAFGAVLIKTTKTAPAITLSNLMDGPLTGISVAASGTGYSQTNTCGTSIAANSTCTITVAFEPTTPAKETGAITITYSAVNSPQTISLTGTGRLPVSVTPVNISFGTVSVGTTSSASKVTVTNNEKPSLTIKSLTFSGTDPKDFAETDDCIGAVAGGGTCTINVTFTPQATGDRTATLSITDNANTSPQTVKLAGTGD